MICEIYMCLPWYNPQGQRIKILIPLFTDVYKSDFCQIMKYFYV